MLQGKTKLKDDYRGSRETVKASAMSLPDEQAPDQNGMRPQGLAPSPLLSPVAPQRKSNRPTFPAIRPTEGQDFQTRVPVIIGEATYRGPIQVEGVIAGQPGNNGATLSVRQRGRLFGTEPELSGEICFKEMLRVNGHIAGTVQSKKGTLIVDVSARIDADVDVAIAVISGTVNGDIVAHQRVEVGPTAKIYGNIWTRSLAIQRGAIFEGVCQMLADKEDVD
jgi:cytoskeletal protein CcmA (bactofilin family)